MSAPVFTAALVQMRSTRSVARNIDAAVTLVREAAARGARYVQTPEMSNIVDRNRDGLFAAIAPPEDDRFLAAMQGLARDLAVNLHIGSLAVKAGDKIANRAFLIGPAGEIVATYDKLHLFDVDLPNGESWRESRTYTAGTCGMVAPLATGGTLGLSICYDLRFPYLYRALAEAGADILAAPACFTRQTGEAHWQVLQRARAIETGSFMLSAAQAGLHEDGRETYGHSIIIDPWGRMLAEGGDEPGLVMAKIDLSAVAEARGRIPTLNHTRAVTIARAAPPADAA